MTTKPSEPEWHLSFGDSLQAIICISESTIQNPFFMASEKAFQIGRPNSVFILIFFSLSGIGQERNSFFFVLSVGISKILVREALLGVETLNGGDIDSKLGNNVSICCLK